MRLKFILFFSIVAFHLSVDACTIVAVSGRATPDGRPLLLKNRDSSSWDIRIKIGGGGNKYVYLCQCNVPDGWVLSGYNETGFAIISSHSYNMPNSDGNWNAYIMQLALERCASVQQFDSLLNALTKPISVCSNYGVMDAQGNVAIFEVGAYTYARYDADSSSEGYLVRTNFSMSQDTTGVYQVSPSSAPRYQIASSFLEEAMSFEGSISKENLFGLTRRLVDSQGNDLRDIAPYDENSYTPVNFQYYVPRRISTSAMVIQGIAPGENPEMMVAWTMVGPPMASVTVPYLITPQHTLPQKSVVGTDGHSWLCYKGHQLKNSIFINNTTIDLAKLYNLSSTGIMQKVTRIEEEVLRLGNELVDDMRINGLSDNDVATYYAWVDYYLEEQYNLYFPNTTNAIMNVEDDAVEGEIEYYDLLGRRVRNVPANAVLKRSGNKVIILN